MNLDKLFFGKRFIGDDENDSKKKVNDNEIKDYPAIRFLSTIYIFLAWIGIFVGIVGYIVWLEQVGEFIDFGVKAVMLLVFLIGIFLFYIFCIAVSELLIIGVDIARDLRRVRLNK